MTETLRLTLACIVAVLALVVLAVGTVTLHTGRRLMGVADRVGPEWWE